MTEDPKSELPKLTDMQKVFIDQYFICGFNASEAARRAGYKDGGQSGWANKQSPAVRAEIDRRMAETHMSADEILSRLEQQAEGTMDDFVYPSGRGVKIDLVRAKKAGKLHLVKSYSKGKQGVRIELYSQKEALELLGRHKKLFVDRTELTGKDGGPLALSWSDFINGTSPSSNPE